MSLKEFIKKAFSKTPFMVGATLAFLLTSIALYAFGVGTRINFTNGSTISSTDVNTNFQNLYDHHNAGLYVKIGTLQNISSAGSCTDSITCGSTGFYVSHPYSNVIFNADAGYDSVNIYTAPVSGIYRLSAPIQAYPMVVETSTSLCSTPSSWLVYKHNGTEMGSVPSAGVLVELGLGDTIEFVFRVTASYFGPGTCTFDLDFTGGNANASLLIEKVF